MTPKEKAKQLYDEHKTLFKHYDANPKLNTGLHEYFKKCALKTVIEILTFTVNKAPEPFSINDNIFNDNIDKIKHDANNYLSYLEDLKYCIKVQKEIEKL